MKKNIMKGILEKMSRLSIVIPVFRERLHRKQILIACFPKSGSTFITTKISELPGYIKTSIVPDHGRRDQHLEGYSIFGSLFCSKNICAQHHCRADQNSIKLLNKYRFKVIVLTRSLMDVALSLSDHWDKESVDGPFAYLDKSLLEDIDQLRGASRLQFIVKHALPWYISFYISWQKHYNEINHGVMFISYESFFKDKYASFKNIMDFIGERTDLLNLENILDSKSRDRLNKGISGRGVNAFRQDLVAYNELLELLSFYPKIDFSPIFTPIDMDDVLVSD